MATKEPKSVVTAVVANLLLPGTGYMYAGRIFLGIVVLLIVVVCALVGRFDVAGVVTIIGVVDGYLTVTKYNAKLATQNKAVEAASTMRCPECAEVIQRDARICKHCRSQLAGAT